MDAAQPLFIEEQKTFEEKKAELLRLCEGKYAVIRGGKLLGTYDTPTAAYEAGIREWGDEPFMVKRVLREEPIQQMPALYRGIGYANL